LLGEALGDHGSVGDEYIAAIRDSVRRLVALDIEFGGDAVSIYAMRTFRAVWRRLRQGAYRAGSERDLYAAAAELAELTGWLLCDANRQLAARRVNHTAMTLAQVSGDRSMELFVTHNMSLQATYLRRPAEARELVRPVLDDQRLTSRLKSMFQLRVARASAQMGRRSEALAALDHATSLFFDGVTDRDPGWSWWISERGINSATTAIYGSLGDWKLAIPPLHRALEATPVDAHRDRHLYLCVLLHAQIELGAWRDAEHTAEKTCSPDPRRRLSATSSTPESNHRPAQQNSEPTVKTPSRNRASATSNRYGKPKTSP
jgi:hypothetical protein